MDSVRIDKWLWAARFYKTRSMATDAVNGGKVHLNGERTKPAKGIKVGDRLDIQRGEVAFEIDVLALSDKRGPAKVAQTLYQELESSIKKREDYQTQRRLLAASNPTPKRRPDKKARRQIHRFKNINQS